MGSKRNVIENRHSEDKGRFSRQEAEGSGQKSEVRDQKTEILLWERLLAAIWIAI